VSAHSRRLQALAILARAGALDRARELQALAVARREEVAAREAVGRHLAEVDRLRDAVWLALGHFAAADAGQARARGASSEALRREHALARLRVRLRHLEELARRERALLERVHERGELLDLLDLHMAKPGKEVGM
jgi:hypothetical protein